MTKQSIPSTDSTLIADDMLQALFVSTIHERIEGFAGYENEQIFITELNKLVRSNAAFVSIMNPDVRRVTQHEFDAIIEERDNLRVAHWVCIDCINLLNARLRKAESAPHTGSVQK